MKKYENLYSLMEECAEASQYFDSLPEYVKGAIVERSDSVNSLESLRHYADNLTQGDC